MKLMCTTIHQFLFTSRRFVGPVVLPASRLSSRLFCDEDKPARLPAPGGLARSLRFGCGYAALWGSLSSCEPIVNRLPLDPQPNSAGWQPARRMPSPQRSIDVATNARDLNRNYMS